MAAPSAVTLSAHRSFVSRRALLFLTLLFTLYRHRHPLLARLRAFARAFGRAAHAANLLSLVFSQTSADVQHYLQPTTRRRNAPAPAPVPRSLRRLLRLAASPDSLAVLHHLAGGVAQGVTRELQTPPCAYPAGTYPDEATQQQPQRLLELMEALAAPAGQAVVRNVVSTAVKEGVHALANANERRRDPRDKPWPEVVVAGVTSDKGRELIVDVATSVARAVVPAIMEGGGTNEMPAVPSFTALSPVASPMRRRRPPTCGDKGAKLNMGMLAGESPVSKQLVMSVMQAQGNSGVVERLALLAIRDKALVRDVVRTVVSEAVRTYLTTQAKLRAQGVGVEGAASECGGGADGGSQVANVDKDGGKVRAVQERGVAASNAKEEGSQNSLWKLLIKSAAVDLKRALLNSAPKEGNTGWLIF